MYAPELDGGRLLDKGIPRISVLAPRLKAKQALLRQAEAVTKAERAEAQSIVAVARQEASAIVLAARQEADELRARADELLKDAEAKRDEAEEMKRQAFIVTAAVSRPSIKQIISEVARRYELKPADIISQRRSKLLVVARYEAIALAHIHCPDLSLPALGRLFKRDHTTILHALRKSGAYQTARPQYAVRQDGGQ